MAEKIVAGKGHGWKKKLWPDLDLGVQLIIS